MRVEGACSAAVLDVDGQLIRAARAERRGLRNDRDAELGYRAAAAAPAAAPATTAAPARRRCGGSRSARPAARLRTHRTPQRRDPPGARVATDDVELAVLRRRSTWRGRAHQAPRTRARRSPRRAGQGRGAPRRSVDAVEAAADHHALIGDRQGRHTPGDTRSRPAEGLGREVDRSDVRERAIQREAPRRRPSSSRRARPKLNPPDAFASVNGSRPPDGRSIIPKSLRMMPLMLENDPVT